jgi:4-methyl-5(b-hydroxyethyl)-thiazole monophosphate biosynthesis
MKSHRASHIAAAQNQDRLHGFRSLAKVCSLILIDRKNFKSSPLGQTKAPMETDPEQYKQPKHVLAIVFGGIEEVEALAPADILRRAGVEKVMVSVSESQQVEGRNGIRFQADQSMSEIDASAFDMIFLSGALGVLPLAKNALITEIIQSYDHESKFVAAIYAAPKVLAQAGILENRPATGHLLARSELPVPSQDRIVQFDHIITSQGAGTAIEFGIKLAA